MKFPSFLPVLLAVSVLNAAPPSPPARGFTDEQKKWLNRSNGIFSLHEAAQAENVQVIQDRLQDGSDPNEKDEQGNTPLHLAAGAGNARIIGLLLRAGADVCTKDARGRTPLQLCRKQAARQACLAGEEARRRELSLADAVVSGDLAQVKASLKNGVSPKALDRENKYTLVQLAVLHRQPRILRALLEDGANPHVKDHRNNTCLHMAASNGDEECLRILLEAGVNPLTLSGNKATPLHDAIWYRKAAAVKILLPCYKSINFSPYGKHNGYPILMAINKGATEIVQLFIEAGFNPNDERLKDEPPLIAAVRKNNKEIVWLLLEAGADRNARNRDGRTASDFASGEIAKMLRQF